ncbi:MAG TPA: 23S rRNA (adenine(2503)-C(2))-methyltransferase RlmN [Chloroflexota bacterium]|nr:23S rRNA (adenine(2503)-C(2))-methyltransferase RlmN [Chloroflexota bacterium]
MLLVPKLPALSEQEPENLTTWLADLGEPPYRVAQLQTALERRAIQDLEELSEFPVALRARMRDRFRVRSLDVRTHLTSTRDRAEKVLFGLADGSSVETVLIPARGSTGRRRLTVCVSSQVGCPAGCTFCATGLSGFGRNLSRAEIVDQVMYCEHVARTRGERITNVVFMGMGEPLLNVRAVRAAIARITRRTGFGLGERSITVSTVGIVPQLRTFSGWAGQVNLAISLHAPTDELRSQLVPYNRHFPIADLLTAVREYVAATNRRVSFEYVLLAGVNDSPALARQLARLLRPLGGHAHVNLIPWNPFREGRFVRTGGPDAETFAAAVRGGGINATVRYSKGLDISAACGQLREQFGTGAI